VLVSPTRGSTVRAWLAIFIGLAGVLTMPAAIDFARRSARVSLMDAAYAVPLAFLLGLVALLMAKRARDNLRWLRLQEGGTGAARLGIVLGLLAVCLALVAALSVGFYEAWLVYEHHRT
jgi:H+/Cl- antiporter ClcA